MGRSRWSSGSRHYAGLGDADDDTLSGYFGFEKFSKSHRGRHDRYADALTNKQRDRRAQRRKRDQELID